MEGILAEAELEAVVLWRIVTGRDHHPAAHRQREEREIEQGRRADADIYHIEPAPQQALQHSLPHHRRARPAVSPHGDGFGARAHGTGAVGASDLFGQLDRQVFPDDPADIVFPEDGHRYTLYINRVTGSFVI